MRGVVAAWVAAVTVVAAACSTFSDDGGSSDGGVPDGEAGSDDASSEAAAVSDSGADADAAPNFGCRGDYRSDLTTAPAPPFSNLGDPNFDSLADDAGPFGRFTAQTVFADGAPPPRPLFYVPFTNEQTHVCLSARVRVVVPPPDSVYVEEMYGIAFSTAGGYGIGGVEQLGTTPYSFNGYIADGIDHAPKTAFTINPDWHVLRVEMDKEDAGGWVVTISVDGAPAVLDGVAFTPTGSATSGQLLFGSIVPNPLDAGSSDAAVVDFADIRADLR